MKHLFLPLLALCTAFALSLSGCGGTAKTETASALCTFQDSEGTEVTLTEKPKKVAVLLSSLAEVWQLSGGEVAVTVGDAVENGYAPEDAVLVNDGAGMKIDAEALVAAEPDFVIGSAEVTAQSEAVATMRDMGIPAALFSSNDLDDYLSVLKIFTDINETPDIYETYGAQMKAQIDDLLNSTEKTDATYLLIRAASGSAATKAKKTEDHFACGILKDFGAVNVADTAEALTEDLSLEAIIQADPDHIFIIPHGDEDAAMEYINELMAQDGWNSLTAVQTDNVHILDKALFAFKPNARYLEAYQVLKECLTE